MTVSSTNCRNAPNCDYWPAVGGSSSPHAPSSSALPSFSPLASLHLTFLVFSTISRPRLDGDLSLLTGIYSLRSVLMHLQKLLPRGKRAGNCLIGRLCRSAVSRMGVGKHFSCRRLSSQVGGLSGSPVSSENIRVSPEALQGTRNGYMNFQALTRERLQKLRKSRRL